LQRHDPLMVVSLIVCDSAWNQKGLLWKMTKVDDGAVGFPF
jgi:hypothetical protein